MPRITTLLQDGGLFSRGLNALTPHRFVTTFEGTWERPRVCDEYADYAEYRAMMVCKGFCFLVIGGVEAAGLAGLDIDLQLLRQVSAALVMLDYLLVTFSKGILSAVAAYGQSACRRAASNPHHIPIHAFAIKLQNLLLAVTFAIGVYVLAWLGREAWGEELENVARNWTYLWIGVHHVVIAGVCGS
eukprot:TRINITY_DN32920_c0_g1_i1.p1 TRINITY_DN32920_c0_g1~~TRINITY_DN32920_c0_g1_i1.p1  ORF type:complete len:187 (+),score=15.89 TRINITY_DN32920_c0_g1_i1:52-612(+)